jgi:molybdopterin/thiamine biosynthesis adenylyltransferase
MFDRQVRAFGAEGQRLLRALTIGVVGCGGTGSPTVEQLARLGVGRLLVVDDDTVDRRSLTRIHQSVEADVGRLKVDVARDSAAAFGTGTVIEAIAEKAIGEAVIRRLAGCDLVFGCTDDHAGRLVLSKLAYHYLVPVIDLGVRVDVGDGRVRGVYGRVTFAAPGYPCLECRGQVDLRLAAVEQMDPQERTRQAAEGYVPGIDEAAPAVVPYTTPTSATAVTEMTARLFGFGEEPPPGQLLLGLHDRSIRAAGRSARAGHYCTDPARWALGDTTPPLGIVGIR